MAIFLGVYFMTFEVICVNFSLSPIFLRSCDSTTGLFSIQSFGAAQIWIVDREHVVATPLSKRRSNFARPNVIV